MGKMNILLKEKYLKVLVRRKEYLDKRILISRKDLSFDKVERNALIYAINMIKKDIEMGK